MNVPTLAATGCARLYRETVDSCLARNAEQEWFDELARIRAYPVGYVPTFEDGFRLGTRLARSADFEDRDEPGYVVSVR